MQREIEIYEESGQYVARETDNGDHAAVEDTPGEALRNLAWQIEQDHDVDARPQ